MRRTKTKERRLVIRNRNWLFALIIANASICAVGAAGAQDNPAREKEPTAHAQEIKDHLKGLVPKLRAEKKLIGLGAMIMVDGEMVAAVVDGERQRGSGVALEVGDRWHLGSITKSMTATMIARLVEKQQLAWTTTVADCLGSSIEIHDDWRGVTLDQLLTHTSGAPPNLSIVTQFQRPPVGKARVQARKKAVAAVLLKKPKTQPGKAFAYSNVGFTIAAAMVEEETGRSWEELIREELFVPMNMSQAGFGPPKDGETNLSQPRGHQKFGPFKRVAGQEDDNSPIMAPAGAVHMTLDELCDYGNEHLSGERGEGKLLKAETYRRLHTPRLKNYAYGWVVPKKNQWTDGRMIWHNGSNTMWYALVAVLPDRNAVVAITSNDGDRKGAEAAAFQIVKEIGKLK